MTHGGLTFSRRAAAALCAVCLAALFPAARGDEPAAAGAGAQPAPAENTAAPGQAPQGAGLRRLDAEGEPYRTPLSGEGFKTNIFGQEVVVEPRDRRYVYAWDLGMAAVAPGVPAEEITPFASLFFWRRPDPDTLLRAVVVGFYDEVIYAKTFEKTRPLSAFFTFDNYTVPVGQYEVIDGFRYKPEEVVWGQVRGGAGLGYMKPVKPFPEPILPPEPGFPGANDNLFAAGLTIEPGYLYFNDGKDSAPNFTEPSSTFELRSRLRLRLDRMQRNLLELPHLGYSSGADVIYGWREKWRDWGIDRKEGADARDYWAFSAYTAAAGGVPFVESTRHRLVGTLHAGTGIDLDRFSSFRVGGGPTGEEFESLSRPVIPGALIEEFKTDRYLVAVGEYRWEPLFFTYLSVRSSVSAVHRKRLEDGVVEFSDDVLGSIGGRVTTGFLFKTRLQLDYNYNAGVLRRSEYGGHEVVVHISREL